MSGWMLVTYQSAASATFCRYTDPPYLYTNQDVELRMLERCPGLLTGSRSRPVECKSCSLMHLLKVTHRHTGPPLACMQLYAGAGL